MLKIILYSICGISIIIITIYDKFPNIISYDIKRKYPFITKILIGISILSIVLGGILNIFEYVNKEMNSISISPKKMLIKKDILNVFNVKLTNNTENPLYKVTMGLEVEKGDLISKDIDIKPEEVSKVRYENIEKQISFEKDFIIFRAPSDGELDFKRVEYIASDINPKVTKDYIIKVNATDIKEDSEISLKVLSFDTKPMKIEIETGERGTYISLFRKGLKYYMSQNYKEACYYFKNCYEENPNIGRRHEIFYYWGSALSLQNQDEEALRKYKMAVEVYPEYCPAIYNIGVLLFFKGNHREAFSNFNKILSNSETSGCDIPSIRQLTYFYAGLCQLHLDGEGLGIKLLNESLKINASGEFSQEIKEYISRLKKEGDKGVMVNSKYLLTSVPRSDSLESVCLPFHIKGFKGDIVRVVFSGKKK